MIPTVLVNPSSSARCAIFSASSEFFTPLPSTELMFTWNTANSESISSRPSSVFRLFFDTSSGTALSMLICRCSSPASFSRSIRSLFRKNPFVISPAIIPRLRICRMISSRSGCIRGSPPLMVMIVVPISARISNRSFISCSGTGLDTSSYSLQYVQSRLQRRIGMMCTRIGCLVSVSAFPIIHSSCRRVFAKRKRFRMRVFAGAFPLFLFCVIFGYSFPKRLLYLSPAFRLSLCHSVGKFRVSPDERLGAQPPFETPYCFPIGAVVASILLSHRSAMRDKPDVWQGTLALMVLKTLQTLSPLHGYGIARRIEQTSGDLLSVNYGTLYPALLKLEQEGYIASEWGVSDNNRKAKYYKLTRAGRKQLETET